MRSKNLADSKKQVSIPFLQCVGCKKAIFKKEFTDNLNVCPYCSHHHRLTAHERIAMTFDPGSFKEKDSDLYSEDILGFPEYEEKLDTAIKKTGRNEGVISGVASIMKIKVSTAVSDFHFMGGSMGRIAGEKISRVLEYAAESKIPAIIFCASGGARMQEGLHSLMQMAKTTAAVNKCREANIPFIAVFTDPTMAGVLASYASIADIIIAEPKALVGFAGARVSKQVQLVKVPDDFQMAEFCLKSGMIDRIVPRKEIRNTLGTLLNLLMHKEGGSS